MSVIWTKQGPYRRVEYENEADLESAILQVQRELFGKGRIYIDVKKKIGKGEVRNIPDGYLLDLSGNKPQLYVVENELASHDPLRHIAVQILQFSLSFESEPRKVKGILFAAVDGQPTVKGQCESYASGHGFRNLDHLLDYLVFEARFSALVIIDELLENLQNVLALKFQFGVEVLELARYENRNGDRFYHFEPFLADLREETESIERDTAKQESQTLDVSEIDTLVVPAREDGFQETFIGENRWYAVRIHGAMRPQIKYIAAYRVAPTSAITHLAPVQSIEPWRDTDKSVLNFSAPAKEIGPIPLVKGGRAKAPMNIRYTVKAKLEGAKTLDDLWGK